MAKVRVGVAELQWRGAAKAEIKQLERHCYIYTWSSSKIHSPSTDASAFQGFIETERTHIPTVNS